MTAQRVEDQVSVDGFDQVAITADKCVHARFFIQ
jgi:hypothetical protein